MMKLTNKQAKLLGTRLPWQRGFLALHIEQFGGVYDVKQDFAHKLFTDGFVKDFADVIFSITLEDNDSTDHLVNVRTNAYHSEWFVETSSERIEFNNPIEAVMAAFEVGVISDNKLFSDLLSKPKREIENYFKTYVDRLDDSCFLLGPSNKVVSLVTTLPSGIGVYCPVLIGNGEFGGVGLIYSYSDTQYAGKKFNKHNCFLKKGGRGGSKSWIMIRAEESKDLLPININAQTAFRYLIDGFYADMGFSAHQKLVDSMAIRSIKDTLGSERDFSGLYSHIRNKIDYVESFLER